MIRIRIILILSSELLPSAYVYKCMCVCVYVCVCACVYVYIDEVSEDDLSEI